MSIAAGAPSASGLERANPAGDVTRLYGPRVSPFIMALDHRGFSLGEGEMDGMEVWRALLAANR